MTAHRPSIRGRHPAVSSLCVATVTVVALVCGALVVATPAAAVTGGPVPADDSYTVDYETTLTVPEPTGVLANDDPGSEADLHVALRDESTLRGSLQLDDESGAFAFTPEAGFYGISSFVYRVGDTEFYSPPATVTFTVRPVGSRDDSYRLGVGKPTLTVPEPGVSGNDPTASAVTTTQLVSPTTHGTVSLASDGSFTYSPTPRYAGTDSFTYAVVEASGTTSYTATVTIVVDPPNADLAVTLSTRSVPRPGQTFTLRVAVVSAGPSQATNVVVGVDVGRALTVTAAPGGSIATSGRTVGYLLLRLPAGARRFFDLTVAVPAGTTARNMIIAAVRPLTMPDFVAVNDRVELTVRPRAAA